MKKSKEKFHKLVEECISRENLTVDIIRKFSSRAREYMQTYKIMGLDADKNVSEDSPILHKMIETLKKMLKSPRAAIDFDKGYIMKVVSRKFDLQKDLYEREEKPNQKVRVNERRSRQKNRLSRLNIK